MSSVGIGIGGALIGGAVISGTAGLIGAGMESGATRDAASQQAAASRYATDIQNQQFQTNQRNLQPFMQAGAGALPQLSQMASNPINFTGADFKANMDPAYQFDLEQGQQALERSAAAHGGLMSGGTLKDLTNYSQGMASHEYQNAYSRFMQNQNTQFDRLSSLSSLGANAASGMASNGSNTANALSNIATSGANAQAGASVAQGRIWGGAVSGLGGNIGNSLATYGVLNSLKAPPEETSEGDGGGSPSLMSPSQSAYWGSNPYSGGGGPSLTSSLRG